MFTDALRDVRNQWGLLMNSNNLDYRIAKSRLPICSLKYEKDRPFVLAMSLVLIFWMASSYFIVSNGVFFKRFLILADPFNLKLAFVQLVIWMEIGVFLLFALKIAGFSIHAIKAKITPQTGSYFLLCFILSSMSAVAIWTLYVYPQHPIFSKVGSLKVIVLGILPWIFGCFLQAFSEELTCHSWGLVVFKKYFGYWLAIFFGGVIFSAMHLFNNKYSTPAIINAFLYGLLLSYVFFKFDSIWASVGLHLGWNLSLDLLNSGHLFAIHFLSPIKIEHGSALEARKSTIVLIIALAVILKMIRPHRHEKNARNSQGVFLRAC